MSDGHWEAVRGSHRDSERDSNSERVAADTGTATGTVGSRVRKTADPLVGWRVWGLSSLAPTTPRADTSSPLFLVSTFMVDFWRPGTTMTACCGANTLRHGIHAFTTQAQAVEYMTQGRRPLRYVFGEVTLWGRVVIHERGYRAECAYPKRIFVPTQYRGSRDIVSELRRMYGVETDWTT